MSVHRLYAGCFHNGKCKAVVFCLTPSICCPVLYQEKAINTVAAIVCFSFFGGRLMHKASVEAGLLMHKSSFNCIMLLVLLVIYISAS